MVDSGFDVLELGFTVSNLFESESGVLFVALLLESSEPFEDASSFTLSDES